MLGDLSQIAGEVTLSVGNPPQPGGGQIGVEAGTGVLEGGITASWTPASSSSSALSDAWCRSPVVRSAARRSR